MQQHSQQFLKKRKLMLFLPLLAVPFLTLFFWAMGGGGGNTAQGATPLSIGLNTILPGAQPDSSAQDKLSLYQRALKDSLSLAERRKEDPYSRMPAWDTADGSGKDAPANSAMDGNPYTTGGTDPNEEKVNRKLEAFKQALNRQPQLPDKRGPVVGDERPPDIGSALDQMESAMKDMSGNGAKGGDPEMDKLDGMLQKIIDIQHPREAQDRLAQLSKSHKGMVYSLTRPKRSNEADLLRGGEDSGQAVSNIHEAGNAFYESPAQDDNAIAENKGVSAVVNETQTLVSGSTIKMRLTEDIYINGVHIPKGNFVFAACQLEGERMKADIKAVRYKEQLFSISLTVYDLDGIQGIKVPGAISRDAAKQGIQQGVQALDFYSMDQSLGAEAANAGIQTAKTLIGGKAKLIRATVRAGYPVLLIDENKRNSSE